MNSKLISGISTAVIMLLIALVLISFGYDPPDPPIPEEGVEVNVGDSDFGLGDNEEDASESSSYAPPAAQNQVSTQNTESSVAMPSTQRQGTITNPNAKEQPVVESKEPEINRNALFTGKRNTGNGGGSQGVTSGTGNQGSQNGTPESTNYSGNGGSGSFTLAGRSAVSLPSPSYNSNQQGKIVVKIWVDQQGRVTRVDAPDKGSTITTGNMVEHAKQAALKARFNASPNAPEVQTGTITYIFKI